jgi:hypothetical protein
MHRAWYLIFCVTVAQEMVQGQVAPDYYAVMTSTQAVPPYPGGPTGGARINLFEQGNLHVYAWVDLGGANDIVEVYRSASADTLGVSLFALQAQGPYGPSHDPDFPAPPGHLFGVDRSLSVDEIAQLKGGEWWLNVSRPSVSGGIMRGQLLAVPEPSTYALIALGLVLFGYSSRRTQRKGHSIPTPT